MTRHRAPRGTRLRVVLMAAVGAALVGLPLAPAGAASASLGSVPAEVSAYVSSGAMVTRLNDVYGPNAAGNAGIKFDSTTKAGPITRVYEWTARRLANQKTDHPVQLTNNWVVPITLAGHPIGLATIWINPQTVEPELASFTTDAAAGTALTAVPAKAALVHDAATGAWLALADGTVTALIAGKSGLTAPAPVDSLRLSPSAVTPATTIAEPNTGLALAIGIVGLIVVIIVAALLLPWGRRRARARAGASGTTAAPPAIPAKPAGARPPGRTPTTAAAAKPASSKPGATRSGTRKPAASKPPISKPPAPEPPRPRRKPPAGESGASRS